MKHRALTLDEEQAPAPSRRLRARGCSAAPAMKVGDDRVDGDPPAGDRDPRLAGRDELAREAAPLCLGIELERDGHLPDRAVRADEEHDVGGDA